MRFELLPGQSVWMAGRNDLRVRKITADAPLVMEGDSIFLTEAEAVAYEIERLDRLFLAATATLHSVADARAALEPFEIKRATCGQPSCEKCYPDDHLTGGLP